MKIVTSGSPYIDIDAYAGIIAFAELLNLTGDPAVAVSTSTWNESITPTLHALSSGLLTNYEPNANDSFVLIDISDPGYLDKVVDPIRVVEIMDHHPGFMTNWSDSVTKLQIEEIGAACTMVYNRWAEENLAGKMSATSAKLLACGILDNTFGFRAKITTMRDQQAYAELARHAQLPDDWPAQYFEECQDQIMSNLSGAIYNDSKILRFKSLGKELCVGQLVIWNAGTILSNNLADIEPILTRKRPDWFMNIVSIEDGQSHFIAQDPQIHQWISKLLDVQFEGNIASADRLWLRKEIMKRDLEFFEHR